MSLLVHFLCGIIFYCIVFYHGNASESCGHIAPKMEEVIHGVNISYGGIKKRSVYKSLRIHTHHDSSLRALASHHEILIKETLLPKAVRYWENTLLLTHSPANIKLRRRCISQRTQYQRSRPGMPYCSYGCVDITTCGDVKIPKTHLDQCYLCDMRGCRHEGSRSRGVSNTHFVLYVSAMHTERCLKGQTVAYAAHCQLEKSLDRPVAGFLNICPHSMETERLNEADLLSTLKHEILHALGFTAGLYAFYRDAYGRPYTKRNPVTNKPPFNDTLNLYMWSDSVTMTVTRDMWRVASGYTRNTVTLIVTPNVKREVRRHFNCSTLEGAEVENQQSYGTALTHWEKRLFENEAMTGTYTQNPVISRISLALMHDTGWYVPKYENAEDLTWDKNLGCDFVTWYVPKYKNVEDLDCGNNLSCDFVMWYVPKYENAEDLTWGKNLGCDFVTRSCLDWIKERQLKGESVHPYCIKARQSDLQTECSLDRQAVTVCNLQEYESSHKIPPQYRYFSHIPESPDKDASQFGGSVVLADYCPYIQEITWRNPDESLRTSKCTDTSNHETDNGSNYLIEKYGDQSKCFEHDGPFMLKDCNQATPTKHWGSGCYKYSCTDQGLTIQVGGTNHKCEYRGQKLHVSHISSEWLHTGVVICPSCTEICTVSQCPKVSKTNTSSPPYSIPKSVPCVGSEISTNLRHLSVLVLVLQCLDRL